MRADPKTAEQRHFARRAAMILGLKAVIGAGLAARLVQLQLVEGADYMRRAERIRFDLRLISPPRGRIFDRNGALLAGARPTYGVFLRLGSAAAVDAELTRLERLLSLTPDDAARLRLVVDQARRRRTRGTREVELYEDVGWDDFARVAANAPALPRVIARPGQGRVYPAGAPLAHVVGYTAPVSQADRAADADPLLREAGARIGRAGVERAAEPVLRGQAGTRRVEIDARQRDIRELDREPPVAGQDVTLTIDAGLQSAAFARLSGLTASAVVMDIQRGDLLALVSTPAFDPNGLAGGLSWRQWRTLNEDPERPLLDRASAGLYPPGSTFKIVTALAALEAGVFEPGETVDCQGKLEFGGRTFHCWRDEGHGPVAMREAIIGSCDVYFFEAARRVGVEKLAETARRFGVGAMFDVGLPQALPGVVPTPEWKRAAGAGEWVGGDTLNMGVGQGDVLMTPLQLAVMTARFAGGSLASAPRLFRSIGGSEPQARVEAASVPPLGMAPAHASLLRDAIAAAVAEPEGTAYEARILDPGRAMAGKTGTSQVRTISLEERATGVRENDELPRRLRDHAMFVGYAPVARPRVAAAVVVEHGGGGGETAAPIARDLLLRAQEVVPEVVPTVVPRPSRDRRDGA